MKQIFFTVITVMIILLGISITTDAQPSRSALLPTGKKLIIQSAVHYGRSNKGCWEKPGGGTMAAKGDNIRVWELDNAPTKRFTLVRSNERGWYEIYIANIPTSRIDVSGNKNIGIWERNGGDHQKFLFKHLGNGRYKIYTKNGKIVNLENQGAGNGVNVQVWHDHDGLHNEWYLLDAYTRRPILPMGNEITHEVRLKGVKVPEGIYYIQSAMSYRRNNKGYLQFPGKTPVWYRKGNLMSIWNKDSNPNKKFHFEKKHNSAYYTITSGEHRYRRLALDCKDGKTYNGTRIQGWDISENNPAQQFYLKYIGNGRFKIYHKSGKVVCLKDNKNDNNGNAIHLWNDHNAITTEWYLINSVTGRAFIPGRR